MAWTAPPVKAVGGTISHTDWNTYVRANLLAVRDAPRCRVTRTAPQSIPNGTYTEVLFTSERYDTASMHSTVSSTGRLTAPVAGVYEVLFFGRLDSMSAGTDCLAEIRKNGAAPGIARDRSPVTGYAHRLYAATHVQLAASDYVTVHVYQASGAAVNLQQAGNYTPEFMMAWLGNPGL